MNCIFAAQKNVSMYVVCACSVTLFYCKVPVFVGYSNWFMRFMGRFRIFTTGPLCAANTQYRLSPRLVSTYLPREKESGYDTMPCIQFLFQCFFILCVGFRYHRCYLYQSSRTCWVITIFVGKHTVIHYTRGGHSHRRRSHSCDRGQEAVKGSRAVFGVGQAVKDNFQTW